jgi:ATP-dependent helicase/nuclease subunit B
VHARHVLRLRPLPELEQAADAADYGTIVHDALSAFLEAHPGSWPQDAEAGLVRAFDAALDVRGLRPALAAWWRPRLARIAAWVAGEETLRRAAGAPQLVRTEILGTATLEGAPGGPFVLSGRADRIERRADGRLALFDYKTGTLPSDKAVQEGWSSQLVLEAAMALRGAFGPDLEAKAAEIVYWRLSGGAEAGRERRPAVDDELETLVDRCWSALGALVAAYDDPDQPYLSHPRPERAPPYPDYAQLARVAEWSAAREDGA